VLFSVALLHGNNRDRSIDTDRLTRSGRHQHKAVERRADEPKDCAGASHRARRTRDLGIAQTFQALSENQLAA
jgi:hypothetical protein